MIPLPPGPVIVVPGRRGQRIQHRADDRGALRGQVPGQHPGAAEGGLQPHPPVGEPARRVLIGQVTPGPLVHLREQRRQARQPQPRRRGLHQ